MKCCVQYVINLNIFEHSGSLMELCLQLLQMCLHAEPNCAPKILLKPSLIISTTASKFMMQKREKNVSTGVLCYFFKNQAFHREHAY